MQRTEFKGLLVKAGEFLLRVAWPPLKKYGGTALRFVFFGVFAVGSWFSGKILKPLGHMFLIGMIWLAMVVAVVIVFATTIVPLVQFVRGAGPFPWIIPMVIVEFVALELLFRWKGLESPIQVYRRLGFIVVCRRTYAEMTFSMDMSWEIRQSLDSARDLWQVATGKSPGMPSHC